MGRAIQAYLYTRYRTTKYWSLQLLEAINRRDEAAIVSFGNEPQKIKLIADQLECHTVELAPGDLALP